MNIDKIAEKIYSEKDMSTNISIFIASIICLLVYHQKKDFYLSLILFLSFFSLTKVLTKFVSKIVKDKCCKSDTIKDFSKAEKNVIEAFVFKGTCFLDVESNLDIDKAGFDSLIARGVIEFTGRGLGDGPNGFYLSEGIYKIFLRK